MASTRLHLLLEEEKEESIEAYNNLEQLYAEFEYANVQERFLINTSQLTWYYAPNYDTMMFEDTDSFFSCCDVFPSTETNMEIETGTDDYLEIIRKEWAQT
ncbi:hypothetical protein M5689_020648 [Euphorbia peplus]|nr:hypothetical protein M5689_020648 [Euphorbia peplus]